MCETQALESLRGDRRITSALAGLRQTDNWTNWLYISRAWGVIGLTIFATLLFYDRAPEWGFSWAWNIPVTVLAILVIGASQHQLAGAGHEATHYMLFRNRLLNELVSDWLCMFPLFTSTHTFRLYHLAHHQYVNDPQRDPDFAMLATSGHWLNFPVRKTRFLLKIARQFLLIDLFRYTLTRFFFNSIGAAKNAPYTVHAGTIWPKLIGGVFFVTLWGWMRFVRDSETAGPTWIAALTTFSVSAGLILTLGDHHFERTKIRPVYPPRWITVSRMAFLTMLFLALHHTYRFSGAPVASFFLLLWVAPLLTSFALWMILRQLVQHGNADRGWVTNSRVFLMNPLIRYAVFPFGMDYHTPHHMYATVPHYRLPQLHQFLMQFGAYRESCTEVRNYVLPEHAALRRPTVLDVLSRENPTSADVWIDESIEHQSASTRRRRKAARPIALATPPSPAFPAAKLTCGGERKGEEGAR